MLSPSVKEDLNEAKTRWEHFWRGELFKRPVVLAEAPKDGAKSQVRFRERY